MDVGAEDRINYDTLYSEFLKCDDFKRLDPGWIAARLVIKDVLDVDDQKEIDAIIRTDKRELKLFREMMPSKKKHGLMILIEVLKEQKLFPAADWLEGNMDKDAFNNLR